MATLSIVGLDSRNPGDGFVAPESETRLLEPEEIDEIVILVIPRIRGILSEPFYRYTGSPEEIVTAATAAYLEDYRRQRVSEPMENLQTKLEQERAKKELKDQLDTFLSEERVEEIRDAVQLVYDMQMSELDQIRLGLSRELQQIDIYPELIEELKENLWVQYRNSEIQYGTPVGYIATDAISAPAVQLTLDTFHSTGSVMNVNFGLDQLQGVLYALEKVRNPFMTVQFNETEILETRETLNEEGEEIIEIDEKLDYVSFETVLNEKRASLRYLTALDIIDGQSIDLRSVFVGEEEDETPWWYDLYNDLYDVKVPSIPATQYMMRLELNMNEMYLSKIDQYQIAQILSQELDKVYVVPSPVLKFPARFRDVYVSEPDDEDGDFDDDREVLVPTVYIDIVPSNIPVPTDEGKFYTSEAYRHLSEVIWARFHEIPIKGIPGIMEVIPGRQNILEVIKYSEGLDADTDQIKELLVEAEERKKNEKIPEKKGSERSTKTTAKRIVRRRLTDLTAYSDEELKTERELLGVDVRDHPPEALSFWNLYIDFIGMRMKGFSRRKLETALEYVGVKIVGWIDKERPMDYIPQVDILECLALENPQVLLREAINQDEAISINYTQEKMREKVELYKEARFLEVEKITIERKSSILERLAFTALADISGYNLEKVWAMPTVNPYLTYCNDMHVIFTLLGIEAARNYILKAIFEALFGTSTSIDIRHLTLVADMLTRRGVIDNIKTAGLKNQNIPAMAVATLEDPLGNIARAASTGEVSHLKSLYAAFIVGQVPLDHASAPEIGMTPEYEKIFITSLKKRSLEAEEIEEALAEDLYISPIVIAEEGQRITTLQGGTVEREQAILPVLQPHQTRKPQGSVLQHDDKMPGEKAKDWVAPPGAVSKYTANAMKRIADDEKKAVESGERQPAESGEPVKLSTLEPLIAASRDLFGVTEVPEGATTHLDDVIALETYDIPLNAKTKIDSILKSLKKSLKSEFAI